MLKQMNYHVIRLPEDGIPPDLHCLITAFDIRQLHSDEDLKQCAARLSAERRKRMERYRFPDDRKRCAVGPLLAEYTLRCLTGEEIGRIVFGKMEKGKPYLKRSRKPFILFGHSLGSRVAYELGIRFEETGQKNFQGLISSGQHAPNIMEKHPIHHLPDSDFFHELSKYNRTPVEIFENKEYWKIFEPPLRADFRMADTYIDQKHRKLHVPILVLCGSLDNEITEEDILEWKNYTTSNISTAIIEGGHLFIDTNMIDVIGRIREFIKKELYL